MHKHISLNDVDTRTRDKRGRFQGKTQSILLTILITRPKKAAVICVQSQGKPVDGI